MNNLCGFHLGTNAKSISKAAKLVTGEGNQTSVRSSDEALVKVSSKQAI